ncbi:ATP-binding protein [Thalassospira alkalitolerans]|uniref:ATP-binding protein n=1 Tax=Thalassospira alkalitolerans TaxID=1293890 RepID=UPI0030EBC696|tara:strand:+ start:51062 stop:52993 length:1932 start_codon:yes stop_codon:yes gene_type:complete
MPQVDLFYDERFLESWAGSIVSVPSTALVELVANCWDAYATKVEIICSDFGGGTHFSIIDDGKGMTRQEFQFIWKTMSYNRLNHGGDSVFPPEGLVGNPRPVFGRNGKGRFAAFCFSDAYVVKSKRDGEEFECRVSRTPSNPLVIEEVSYTSSGVKGHGTEIRGVGTVYQLKFSEDEAREIVGGRFLANPSFEVFVNKRKVTFSDLSENSLRTVKVDVPEYGELEIIHIDAKQADKTTKQHGIAWWVSGRAVGECRWSGSDLERILDGRTNEAKRFTFIVQANFLKDFSAVEADWSAFIENNNAWITARDVAQNKIKEIIDGVNFSERDSRKKSVIEKIGRDVERLPPLSKDRVSKFVDEVVDQCPSLREQDIVHLSSILANLEKSSSQFGLLELLHDQAPHDLDALHDILSRWSIGMAKIVLDEIQTRLKIIHELKEKVQIDRVDEVHELQPLFEKGLWMFGPQFESIEFTSNKGMTTVIRDIFKDKKTKGTKNRPDFVILPDTSIGFYARNSYDEDYNENGIEHLVVVDLKTTKLPLGSSEKEQVWKYIKELKRKGKIQPYTRVDGFILGTEIESGEGDVTGHGSNVKVIPMLYDTVLARAETRLLNLYTQVKDAPFLSDHKNEIEEFDEIPPVKQGNLNV